MDLAATPDPEHIAAEQRFRASVITSVAVHLLTFAVLVFGPMLLPRPVLMPDVLPVTMLPSGPPPTPTPQPEREPEPVPEEPEPEPVEEEPADPEPPQPSAQELRQEQLRLEEARREQQRRERERLEQERLEQQRREQEEARRRAEEEAERRRRAEEERRRKEEEERAKPQKAGRRPEPEPERQRAQRQSIDLTGTEENQTDFTVEEFPFAAYLMTIRDLVGARWNAPERGAFAPALRAVVFFRVGRDGRVVAGPRILTGSGNSLFDQAAMRAIATAAPFPPLPREFEGASLGVRFAFIQE